MAQVIVTAVGPDRPGLVGELTGHVHSVGGNILDSRMVNLRGQFAIVMLFEVGEDAAARVVEGLPAVAKGMGLSATAGVQGPAGRGAAVGLPFKLKTYSMDQPGIVHRVTAVLRELDVNIEDLSARQESAPFAGSPLFVMEARVTVPATVGVRELRGKLQALCDTLNCDLDLEPA